MASEDGVSVASVALWLPRVGSGVTWRGVLNVAAGAVVAPIMALGLEPGLFAPAAAIAIAVLGFLGYREYRRREWIRTCRPSVLQIGEGHLELRLGAGDGAETRRWPLDTVRAVRFQGQPLGVGGTVELVADGETVRVPTGSPVDRTKAALRAARRAARVQGFELGKRSAGTSGATSVTGTGPVGNGAAPEGDEDD